MTVIRKITLVYVQAILIHAIASITTASKSAIIVDASEVWRRTIVPTFGTLVNVSAISSISSESLLAFTVEGAALRVAISIMVTVTVCIYNKRR